MMTKTQLVLVFAVAFVGILSVCKAQDISLLLKDKFYVEKQLSCVLGKGPCDPIGRQLVDSIPEVVNNNCARCTPQQARNARKLVEFMQQRYPNEWRTIVQRYTVNKRG